MTKNIWAPLGITAAASTIDVGIQKKKKIHCSRTTTLTMSNKEMNDVMKITFYWKELQKQLKMKQKQKRRFLSMLLGTSRASLLGNMLAGKGIVKTGYGNKERKGMLRAEYGSKK